MTALTPTLKLVSAWSPNAGMRERVEALLRARAPERHVRYLHGRVFLLWSDATPQMIREWFASVLGPDESLFVAEVAAWSAHGGTLDHEWLRALTTGDAPLAHQEEAASG